VLQPQFCLGKTGRSDPPSVCALNLGETSLIERVQPRLNIVLHHK
jgi:hypothetical protein